MIQECSPFSSPEAALLLVSTKNRDLWLEPLASPLAKSNTGSPRFTDFPSHCACSESSLTNLIGSGLNLLCLLSHSKTECRWTRQEVAILGADQKERGLWGREWNVAYSFGLDQSRSQSPKGTWALGTRLGLLGSASRLSLHSFLFLARCWHRGGGGYSIYPWVGRCGAAPHSLTLFKTNIADFPTLFNAEFRFFNTLFMLLVSSKKRHPV